jgi:PAS domain S-box-containing protein
MLRSFAPLRPTLRPTALLVIGLASLSGPCGGFGSAAAATALKSRAHRKAKIGATPTPPPSPTTSAVTDREIPTAPGETSLTTAAAIRALSPEQAAQALPIVVRGVITCAGSLTFIQDQTAGIFVDVPVSTKGRYQVGQFGDLHGYTAPGLFAPQIVPRRFNVLGTTPLPAARAVKFDELSTGKLDSQRVEISGIVRAVMPDERPDLRRTVTLKMAADDGVFPVTVSNLPPDKLGSVADASVRVRGVAAGVFNQRRQMIGIRLYVGRPDDFTIEDPGPPDPYAVSITPVEQLLRFQPEGLNRHRVRVKGTVTLFRATGDLFVEDETGGVAARTRQTDSVTVGDRVEVLGFPEMGAWTPFLDDAVFRRAGPSGAAAAVAPISVTADQELSTGAHDSRLVSLEAELVDSVADAGRLLLLARAKNTLFDAELQRSADGPDSGPFKVRNGSRVRLTGISVVRLGGGHDHPTQFRLLLRNLDDIQVLQKPSWWTFGRLIWILVALAAVAALAVGWGVVLRRRMRVQTEIIRRRIASENALEARYRELFDNANDIVYTHDTAGRLLTVNRAGETITGYSRDELLQRTIFDLAPPERREAVAAWLAKLVAGQPTKSTFEAELVAKGGRFVPLELSIRPLSDATGITAVEGIARDITERKRAQADLEAAQQRLIETLRRAGMAEVAAGVLHNVGDVLTSVTESARNLGQQLRGSNLHQLEAAVATVQAHAKDLPTFLTDDPSGRELPAHLAALAQHLGQEQAAIAREVESLGRSVEHIKGIVVMQQGYAQVSGVREQVAAETLIDDALRINQEVLDRHRISVVRDFSKAPPLLIEKHRVLEILVHLLSNARYACDGRVGGAPSCITVRIDTPRGERASERVRIVVADNGIGIAHEHLTRIFEHGFTTRSGGRGFGLHSASMTARDLGGSLFVYSDGIGKGARFTLDLPVRPPQPPGALHSPPPARSHQGRQA